MPGKKQTAKPASEFLQADKAAKFILSKTKLRPKIALILGSGLGAFADEFSSATKIPYAKIPNFPRSTAIGHAGQLVLGTVDGIAVAGMQGRVHLYEGYSRQASRISGSRVRTHGRKGHHRHQRRGWNQSELFRRCTGRAARPHQSAGCEPAHWTQ